MREEEQKVQAQERRSNAKVIINAGTCATLASKFILDEVNVDDIYIEDEEEKSFEEVLQRENLLFQAFKGETSVYRLEENENLEQTTSVQREPKYRHNK